MNKSELCTQVAAQPSVSTATADAVISAVFSTIAEALTRDETIAIAGFGTFSTRARAARRRRNPATGETIATAASKTPAFKAANKLRETFNAGK